MLLEKVKNQSKSIKMFQKLVLIAFCFASFHVFSQYDVNGQILNQENKPLDMSEVYLIGNTPQNIVSTLTDAQGFFKLSVGSGTYQLEVKLMGSTLYTSQIVLTQDKSLGILKVNEKTTALNEVVLSAHKKLMERKIDRLVFNVGNSVSASGKDVFSALQVTPGVRVTENAISIVGKSSVMVMIDDQMVNLSGTDLTNFLKSLSADDIAKFEVITTPPAKYEAQGNSGIINIRYKKGKKNNWNSTLRNSFTKTTYSAYGIGGSFNYQKNKVSLTTNATFYTGSKRITDTNIMTFSDQIWSGNQPRKVTYEPLSSLRAGVDFQLTSKINVGMLYLGSFNELTIKNDKNKTNVNYVNPSLQDYDIVMNSISKEKTPTHSVNLHSDVLLDTLGKKILFNVDYFRYKNDINRAFDYGNYIQTNLLAGSFSAASNSGNQLIENYALKVDVEYPMQWANLSYGGKLSFVNSSNDLRFYDTINGVTVLNENQSNLFDYKEHTQAIYGSIAKSIKKWDFQLGLRLENTQNEGLSVNLNEKNENNYLKVFPTVYFNYKWNDNNTLSWNYSKRIERPQFDYLNPFRIVQNAYNYVEGNPLLQPSYADNVEFSWLHKQKWSNTLYFSKISQGFQQISIIDPATNVQQIKPLNYYDAVKLGWNDSYTFNAISWWESTNAIDVNYSDAQSQVSFTNPGLSGWNCNFSTANTFILNAKKTWTAGVNFWQSLPGVYDIYKISASSSLDVSLSCLFLDKALSVNVYANDIFSGQRVTATGYSNQVGVSVRNYYDSRNFKISIAYKFGNKKVSVTSRDFGNEDEKKRVKN